MELTEDDVLEILKLFEQSKFDFLQLEQGERKITISKAGYRPAHAEPAPVAAPAHPAPVERTAPGVAAAKPAPTVNAGGEAPAGGLLPISAPMVGKFYAAPSPSDPPFVTVGTHVAAEATVGLIEVMKVFASIKAEKPGVIEKVLVSNGQMVEFGQTLFWLRPDP